MNTRQSAELRRLLSTIDRTNAFELFDQLERLVGHRILRRGRATRNALLDRLVSNAAIKAFGSARRIPPQWYFELRGLWQVTFPIGSCNVWVLYDELDEHGLVGFARPGVPPTEWFFPISRTELPNVDAGGRE